MISRIVGVLAAILLVLWLLNANHFHLVQHAFNHIINQLVTAVH